MIKPYRPVVSDTAWPINIVILILPAISGWRAIASTAWAATLPSPKAAAKPVNTAKPAPIAFKPTLISPVSSKS